MNSATETASGKSDLYRIFFRDKGDGEFSAGSELWLNTEKLHSEKSIQRRLRIMEPTAIFTVEDAPVYEVYIDSVKTIADSILHSSRWFNYVLAEADSAAVAEILQFDFVSKVQSAHSVLNYAIKSQKDFPVNALQTEINFSSPFAYGACFAQLQSLNIPELHSLGICGQGIMIGVIDNGFNLEHDAFSNLRLSKAYDFIQYDSITANQPGDTVNQDGHGSLVLSVMAGYYPGILIGAAPLADYVLAKTENMKYERQIELDNFLFAVEWMESQGCDIINSSLGYRTFDSTEESFSEGFLDGRSSPVAAAYNLATERGVVCVTSAGNEGPEPMTLSTPGDCSSAITVGAVDAATAEVLKFSSRGPNASGELKPDISAQGNEVIGINSNSDSRFIKASGTSLSSPLIAGAAALMLQSTPRLSPNNIKDRLRSYASHSENPDNNHGFGVPDIYLSISNGNILITPHSFYTLMEYQRVVVHLISSYNVQSMTLHYRLSDDEAFADLNFYPGVVKNQYVADIPLSVLKDYTAECYVTAETTGGMGRYPAEQTGYFYLKADSLHIPPGYNPNNLPLLGGDYAESYLYPKVVDRGINHIVLNTGTVYSSDAEVKIFDITGSEVYFEYIPTRAAGKFSLQIPVGKLSSGSYYLVIRRNSRTDYLKFIKL